MGVAKVVKMLAKQAAKRAAKEAAEKVVHKAIKETMERVLKETADKIRIEALQRALKAGKKFSTRLVKTGKKLVLIKLLKKSNKK